jgi:hypothetical protein
MLQDSSVLVSGRGIFVKIKTLNEAKWPRLQKPHIPPMKPFEKFDTDYVLPPKRSLMR